MNGVAVASAGTMGRGGLFFGTKSLDSRDWGNLDSQSAWGINLDVKGETWPVWVSSTFLMSEEKEIAITSISPLATKNIEGKTTEFRLGLKKDFLPFEKLRLSAAGGPAYIDASLDNVASPFNSDSGAALGYWLGAEAIIYLGHLALGAGYNYSEANVTLLNRSVNAGGSNFMFTFGFGW